MQDIIDHLALHDPCDMAAQIVLPPVDEVAVVEEAELTGLD